MAILNSAPDWLSIGEAADLLQVSRDTLRRWEKRGKIKSYRSPTNRRMYKKTEIVEIYQPLMAEEAELGDIPTTEEQRTPATPEPTDTSEMPANPDAPLNPTFTTTNAPPTIHNYAKTETVSFVNTGAMLQPQKTEPLTAGETSNQTEHRAVNPEDKPTPPPTIYAQQPPRYTPPVIKDFEPLNNPPMTSNNYTDSDSIHDANTKPDENDNEETAPKNYASAYFSPTSIPTTPVEITPTQPYRSLETPPKAAVSLPNVYPPSQSTYPTIGNRITSDTPNPVRSLSGNQSFSLNYSNATPSTKQTSGITQSSNLVVLKVITSVLIAILVILGLAIAIIIFTSYN